jgi:hypothetical protein
MTPISKVYVPDDIVSPIIMQSIYSISDLGKYRTVCKDFKRITDNKEFLQRLLVKMKGEHFADAIYSSDPLKYLAFDREITKVFKTLVQNEEFSNEQEKKLFSHIFEIVLTNLHSKTLYVKRRCECHGGKFFIYTCSKAQIFNLKNVDFSNRNRWNACLLSLASSILNHKTNNQIAWCLEKGKAAFDKLDEKIQAMTKYFQITETFLTPCSDPLVINSDLLVINSERKISSLVMYALFCSPEEYKLYFKANLYREIIEDAMFTKNETGQIVFFLSKETRHSLIYLYKNSPLRVVDLLNQLNFNTADNVNNDQIFNTVFKSMVAYLFPEIFRNPLDLISQAMQKTLINCWMVKIYASVREKPNKREVNEMHKTMVERLNNPNADLKLYIEQIMIDVEPPAIVSLPWKEWFPEVWPKEEIDLKGIHNLENTSSDKG